MAEEVDQASIDVIKTLFESKNGKQWFFRYLAENLMVELEIPSADTFEVKIIFHGNCIVSNKLKAIVGLHRTSY